MRSRATFILMAAAAFMLCINVMAADTVKIGFNYPKTGPYAAQGLDEMRAAEMAVEEINAEGGILGKKVVLEIRDSQSKPDISAQNAEDLINQGVQMIFGGASSGVAQAVSEVCQKRSVLFLATIAASNNITDENAHRYTFRVCYNAWMGAKALGKYMRTKYAGKKYFYITADYSWGRSSEESLRKFTGTTNAQIHKGVRTPFPAATDADFVKAVALAKEVKPDVLIMVLFGDDMSKGLRAAADAGLKNSCQIVVPILELGLAEGAGPNAIEGVLGTSDWNWQVPYKYNYSGGIKFVTKFKARYDRYPCWGASTAYTNMLEYKNAVERAKSFKSSDVVKALEGHKFTLLKDEQEWRAFDHQCVQSVYIVKCKTAAEINKDPLKLDYFDVQQMYPAEGLARTRSEWNTVRASFNKLPNLEPLTGTK